MSNNVFFDVNNAKYVGDFFFNDSRLSIVAYFKSAEKYANDMLHAYKKDLNMSEVIDKAILKNVWLFIDKLDEKIENRVFKYSKDAYISFGLNEEDVSRFLKCESDSLFMHFNCVDKEGTEPDFIHEKNKITIHYNEQDGCWATYKGEPKEDPIESGYIPVEYNHYKELTEKAAKYDKIQDYISKMEKKDANI